MGEIRIGASELGLQLHWRFAFLGPGSQAATTPDAIFLDLGGAVAPGVLDEHGAGVEAGSCAELVLRFPELAYNHLVGPWLDRQKDGRDLRGVRWSPVIVTHRQPDFDALVSAHLVMELVEHGQLPSYSRALVAYTSEVDQGRYRIDPARRATATEAIHMAYLAIQNLVPPTPGCDQAGADRWHLRRGLTLLRRSMGAIASARTPEDGPLHSQLHLHPGEPGVAAWRDDPDFADACELLDTDAERYLADRAVADLPMVDLPAADGEGTIRVHGFVCREPPSSYLNKYWVRADGIPYFVCPYPQAGRLRADEVDGKPRYPQVIISVDPEWTQPATGRRLSLHGLGYRLEQAEVATRTAGGGRDERGSKPRWADGSCDNDDPWYDGRGDDFTIVSTPRSGTRLSYERVCTVATGSFADVPLVQAHVVLFFVHPLDLDAEGPSPTWGAPVPAPAGTSTTLRAYFAASRDSEAPAPPGLPAAPAGFSTASIHQRQFPPGTCPPMTLVEIEAGIEGADREQATLEQLAGWCKALRASADIAGPHYMFAQLRVGSSLASEGYCRHLLHELAAGDCADIDRGGDESESGLLNSRNVVLRRTSQSRGPAQGRAELDLELVTYAAFVNESAASYSRRISHALARSRHDGRERELRLTPATRALAAHLRQDFLEFQTRYYQLDTSTCPQGRHLLRALLGRQGFAEHYAEVQSELDRLHQVEERAEGLRRSQVDRAMAVLLGIIGLADMIQIGVALHAMETTKFHRWELAAWTLPWVLLALILMAWAIWLLRRSRR